MDRLAQVPVLVRMIPLLGPHSPVFLDGPVPPTYAFGLIGESSAAPFRFGRALPSARPGVRSQRLVTEHLDDASMRASTARESGGQIIAVSHTEVLLNDGSVAEKGEMTP